MVSVRRQACRSSTPGEIRLALVALLRAVLRSSAFGRCPEVVPVDAEASVITGCEDAELAKLAQSAGGVSVYHQRYIVGAGIL